MIKNAIRAGFANWIARRPLNSSTEIRLTRLCTQRCRQCSVYERKTEPSSLSLERFTVIAQRLREYGAVIGFISGGEALLVPDLVPILREAKKTFPLATTLVTGLVHKTETVCKTAEFCLHNGINIQTSLDGLGETGDKLRGVEHFSDTVLNHMHEIGNMENKGSLLYCNIVINNLNLEQVPDLIREAKKRGWKSTIGMYHHLTETTREDQELIVRPGPRLSRLINFLDGNTDILNLNSFIRGIQPFLNHERKTPCPFVASPIFMTRTTIMEDGNVHLCWGDPIGNILQQDLKTLFSSAHYQKRLHEYSTCAGCWTTCYTQRYLLLHPQSAGEMIDNGKKMFKLKFRR